VGRHDENCFRIINTKIEKVDRNAFIKFTGELKAQIDLINQEKSDSGRTTPVVDPNGNDRGSKREKLMEDQKQELQQAQEKLENEEHKN